MKSKTTIYIILLGIMAFSTYGQKKTVKKADEKYSQYAYIDAIKTYEHVAEKGYKSVDMFKCNRMSLSECLKHGRCTFRFNSNYSGLWRECFECKTYTC